jgi:hypothetical protein
MSLFGSPSQASSNTVASGVSIQSSVYGSVIPVVYGRTRMVGNLIWYGDFQAIPQNSGGSGSGKGGGGGGKDGGSGTYDYKCSFLFALGEGTLGGVVTVYSSKTATAWGSAGLAFANGALTQAPWGYLTTKYPGKDLSYAGTGYVFALNYDLGNSAQMPNLSYEVTGLFANAIAGLPDADPANVVSDMLTNLRYGVGFPAARLGDLSVFSGYCRAAGLVVSPLFDTQQDAASLINAIVQDCNAEFVWSGATLTVIPYGDEDLSANGASYAAPSAPLYSLTDDDFLDVESGDPVTFTRARPSDQMNSIKLEWLNRGADYNIEVVEAKDLAAIQVYGLRAAQPSQSHYFCNLAAATMSATLTLQRQAVRNQYTFTLGWRYCLLDPMDIVAITDATLGLAEQWVRIMTIEEDDNGNLKITAQDYLGGTAADYNVAPGSVNQPLIFEPPPTLSAGVPQVWIGASGGANWGGADIWLSTDNATYQHYGRITAPARQGVLTAALPAGADPDTTDTLAVDLSESAGVLLSGTEADANSYQTLCYVDGELIAYETATLTATNAYSLTYLRRGAYGSAIGAHASGSQFCRLDQAVVAIDLPVSPVSYIGTTIYVKLLSFNLFGGGGELLADVDAYSYAPTGIGATVAPPASVSMATGYVQQADGTIQPYLDVLWTASPDTLFDSYQVEISAHGANHWNGVTVGSSTLSYRYHPIATGVAFDARVRAVRSLGPYFSTWVEATNVTTVGKAAASADPTALAAAGGYQAVVLTWTAAAATDIAWYEIWEGPSATLSAAAAIGVAQSTNFTAGGLADDTAYWFWIRSINTSGVAGDFVGPVGATTNLVQTGGIAPGAVSSVASEMNAGLTINTNYMTVGVATQFPMASATVVTTGGEVDINVALDDYSVSAGTGEGDLDPSFGLYRDGTLLTTYGNDYVRDFYYDTPAAGTHTYALIAAATFDGSVSARGLYTYGANSIRALALKR